MASPEHADLMKMTFDEMRRCGCERCADGLKMHATLDLLIRSQDRTLDALDKLERSVSRLENERG